jgi:hypothetical protein
MWASHPGLKHWIVQVPTASPQHTQGNIGLRVNIKNKTGTKFVTMK